MSYPFTLFSSREAIKGIVVLMHHRRRSASVATATTSTSFAPEEDEDVKPIIRKPKPRKRYVSTCADSLEMLMSPRRRADSVASSATEAEQPQRPKATRKGKAPAK